MSVVDQEVRSSAYAVELRAAAPLMRALKNGLVAAAPAHELVRSLRAVQIHFDGTVLEVQATDRYLALFEQVAGVDDQAPASEPFKLLLPTAECKKAVAFLREVPKLHPVTLTWTTSGGYEWSPGTLVMASYDSSLTLEVEYHDDAPRLSALVPKGDRVGVEMTGFRRSIIQGIGKIEAESKDPILKLSLYGDRKVIRVDWPGERRTLLAMQVRIVENASEWGVSGL